jgi:hypothetical protein
MYDLSIGISDSLASTEFAAMFLSVTAGEFFRLFIVFLKSLITASRPSTPAM